MTDIFRIIEKYKKNKREVFIMYNKMVSVLIILFAIGCNTNSFTNGTKTYKINEIPANAVERLNNSFMYIIKFSNLIYDVDGKKVKIPIYNGNLADVEYNDFKKYCRDKKILDANTMESGFVVRTQKGELKKTIIDFIKFYQRNISQGFEKPFEVYTDGDQPQYLVWNIVYKFSLDGIPCSVKISFEADKKDWEFVEKIKTIEDMHPDENTDDPIFAYEIIINNQE